MRETFYIFGGTFDPFHEGHVGVIRELLAQDKHVVIAPTESNPFKNSPSYTYQQRLEMIKKVLDYEKIDFSTAMPTKLLVCDFKYSYVFDFVKWWRSNYSGELSWVIGPDLVDEVKKWKNWDQMNLAVYISKNYANDLHSSDVRNLIRPIHPALKN